MLAEVKKRCSQVFDACDSSESFPGNGLDLVLAEVSAHGEVTCQKPKTHLINSAQIITNIREEQVVGVEGGGGGWADMTFMISGTIWSKELQRQKWWRLQSICGVCSLMLVYVIEWRQRLGKNRRSGSKNKSVWESVCVPLTFVM